jgi:N-acetylglucosaminyldiphosphoundecaprenol N-acetyl-beta-D-mannosaminyltransferase
MRQTVGILGTPVDILDTKAVLERLEQFVQEGRFHQVATANTDFLINALADPEQQHILRNADLVIPDGMPVVWAARRLRSFLPERVTGADLVPQLAELAARRGYRLFMLGARQEVARSTKAYLEAEYPGIQIVGCVSPPVASLIDMDSEAILDEIERARPDILLVAFGNPKQEKWIYLHRERLCGVPVCVGVGGTFDFLAGLTSRAPKWMQDRALEWLYRLLREPRRLWRRYARDIRHFFPGMLKLWWPVFRGRRTGTSQLYTQNVSNPSGSYTVLSVIGDFDTAALPGFQREASEALDAGNHLILDFHSVTVFDGEALGTLLNLPKRAAYRGCDVCMISPPTGIAAALRRSGIDDNLYTFVESVAKAFDNRHRIGLFWRISSGQNAAVVEVSGTSDPRTVRLLEQVCADLLDEGKRVDLDARDVTYADCYLLSALYRLTNGDSEARNGHASAANDFRIVASPALMRAMQREKLSHRLTLCEAVEMPSDAVEQSGDSLVAGWRARA